MTTIEDNIERLVRKLIYQHCHGKSKEYRVVVAKYLTNDLDFDEAQDIIDVAEDRLSFVITADNLVWYLQNEELILYIRDDTSMNLNIIGGQFSHLTPPTLRQKYDIPNTRH